MKNIKKCFILLSLLLFTFNSQLLAQKKHHNISIHSAGYYCFTNFSSEFKQDNAIRLTSLIGVKYQYDFHKKLSAYANITLTNNANAYWLRFLQGGDFFTRNAAPLDKDYMTYYPNGAYKSFYKPDGQLWYRDRYYFFDLGINYTYSINDKNSVSGHLGLSYAYGYNEYIIKALYPPYPSFESFTNFTYKYKWEGYWGAVAGLSYDYYFWKERMNAGVTVNLRYYEKGMPFFTDYGLHVGYNF